MSAMKNPKHSWLIICGVIVSSVAIQFYLFKRSGDRDGLFWGLIGIAAFIVIFGFVFLLNIVLFEPLARFLRRRRETDTQKK